MRFYLGYKSIKRLHQIVSVLIKYGFYPLLERLHLTRIVSLPQKLRWKKAMREVETVSEAERLRRAIEELGPSFIKLGQILSTRSDLLPEDYISELLKLQDEVSPIEFGEIRKIVREELGAPLDELFTSVDERPIAAASIAQVHRAVTKDGEDVVVKVQRPNIEEIINADVAVILYIARLMERYLPESRLYGPTGMVEEFSTAIKKEMDFTLEGSYTGRFRERFADDERVVIPKVFWNLTTKRVLTMERIEGIKIDNTDAMRREGIDTRGVAHTLANQFFRQVFEFGFFHGDLHSGNIFVVGQDRIAFVDFGIVGNVDAEFMENLADILIGIGKEDYELLTKVYMRMGMVPEDIDRAAFRREYHDLLLHYFGRPVVNTRIGELLVDYMRIAARYRIKLPQNLLLLSKCLIELEGLGRLLHPGLNILKESEQYAEKLLCKKVSPSAIAGDVVEMMRDYHELTKNLPSQLNQILRKMTSDRFTIDFMHKGLEDFMGEIDRSSNRLTVGIIVAALIIGASLVLAFEGGPFLFGYPVIGVLGFVTAGLLGIWLAALIIKSGKF